MEVVRAAPSPRLFAHTEISQLIDSLHHQRTSLLPLSISHPPIMPAPTTTLLIEGSFSELADEFAQYLDALRKEGSLQSEIAPLLQPLRQQEQSEGEPDLKQRDEVLKKLVGAAAALNGAPEKGELVDFAKSRPTSKFDISEDRASPGDNLFFSSDAKRLT